MAKHYCNKCGKEIKELNDLEAEEEEEQGAFVCSSCINDEMEDKENSYNYGGAE